MGRGPARILAGLLLQEDEGGVIVAGAQGRGRILRVHRTDGAAARGGKGEEGEAGPREAPAHFAPSRWRRAASLRASSTSSFSSSSSYCADSIASLRSLSAPIFSSITRR